MRNKPESPQGRDIPSEEPTNQGKRVPAIFYRSEAGGELVREWLKQLSAEDRKRIGEDIKTVEFGWPIGMPVCRPLGNGLYEVRTSLAQNRIARVLFYIDKRGRMVLLARLRQEDSEDTARGLRLGKAQQEQASIGLEIKETTK